MAVMSENIYDLVIIGAGAAGLMAAAEASHAGVRVLVLEGQREPGVKILMAGGGRCNATHARVSAGDYSAGCRHTLMHVLKTFTPREAVAFFEKWGAPLALQETGEFFSADNHARTVRDALVRAAVDGGARIECQAHVDALTAHAGMFKVVAGAMAYAARSVLITTGGLSFPVTGSDGSGYALAAALGHRIVPTRPALVPLMAGNPAFSGLAGIVVAVRLSLWSGDRKLRSQEGPLLFTHHGFSGPAPMEMSGAWMAAREQHACALRVDFLPAAAGDGIDFIFDPLSARRSVKNVLARMLPERLVVVLLEQAGVDPGRLAGDLGRQEKRKLAAALRALPLPVAESAGYAKAEVTAGGVDLRELKGATLESRLQGGLFFAGEVVDVDGRIGGFNLHWAWASGVAAARAVIRRIKI